MTKDNNLRPYSHYFINVIAIPIILLISAFVLVYFLTTYFGLSPTDKIFGYVSILIFFLLYRFKMRLRWTEFPNGQYFYSGNIKSDKLTSGRKDFIEPTYYDKEFSYSKETKITYLGLGVLMIGVAYFLLSQKDVILPFILFLAGIYFFVDSIRALVGGPIIKISKQGIWTKETGYYPWTEITKIYLSRESTQKSVSNYLNIFIKTDFDAREYPTFKILVTDIKDFSDIETAIADNRAK